MIDSKKCKLCGSHKLIKKNGLCLECSTKICRARMTTRGVIFNSVRYGINSYIWKFLPYSVNDLKIHLEKQFENWMT